MSQTVLLRELEYLVALARERHFARAAAACHVSQPSLSTAIRKLERELDVQIVRRGHRFAGLTPEGERVLLWAHRILAGATALQQDLASMRGELTGTLRLGAIPTALTAASLLTTPLCTRHPEIRVTLTSLSSREVAAQLAGFELDVALTYLDDDTLVGMKTFPLYEERYLLLTPASGPLAERPAVTWPDVAKLPLVLLTPRMRNRRIIDGLFAAHGPVPAPAVETDTVDALYAHIATRRWSSVIAHAWLHTFGVPSGMRVVPLSGRSGGSRIGLVAADRQPEPYIVRALVDLIPAADVRGTLQRLLRTHLNR
ncbi:LysR substrate-binding domain-containing protein [Actinoplanes sp. NPDC049265]|uniref:LysR family transcriptional regulator n=1 Tax=Actinoplanes sp. NPDC049265 TaxID=3363902 RepID=UPI0037173DFA